MKAVALTLLFSAIIIVVVFYGYITKQAFNAGVSLMVIGWGMLMFIAIIIFFIMGVMRILSMRKHHDK